MKTNLFLKKMLNSALYCQNLRKRGLYETKRSANRMTFCEEQGRKS